MRNFTRFLRLLFYRKIYKPYINFISKIIYYGVIFAITVASIILILITFIGFSLYSKEREIAILGKIVNLYVKNQFSNKINDETLHIDKISVLSRYDNGKFFIEIPRININSDKVTINIKKISLSFKIYDIVLLRIKSIFDLWLYDIEITQKNNANIILTQQKIWNKFDKMIEKILYDKKRFTYFINEIVLNKIHFKKKESTILLAKNIVIKEAKIFINNFDLVTDQYHQNNTAKNLNKQQYLKLYSESLKDNLSKIDQIWFFKNYINNITIKNFNMKILSKEKIKNISLKNISLGLRSTLAKGKYELHIIFDNYWQKTRSNFEFRCSNINKNEIACSTSISSLPSTQIYSWFPKLERKFNIKLNSHINIASFALFSRKQEKINKLNFNISSNDGTIELKNNKVKFKNIALKSSVENIRYNILEKNFNFSHALIENISIKFDNDALFTGSGKFIKKPDDFLIHLDMNALNVRKHNLLITDPILGLVSKKIQYLFNKIINSAKLIEIGNLNIKVNFSEKNARQKNYDDSFKISGTVKNVEFDLTQYISTLHSNIPNIFSDIEIMIDPNIINIVSQNGYLNGIRFTNLLIKKVKISKHNYLDISSELEGELLQSRQIIHTLLYGKTIEKTHTDTPQAIYNSNFHLRFPIHSSKNQDFPTLVNKIISKLSLKLIGKVTKLNQGIFLDNSELSFSIIKKKHNKNFAFNADLTNSKIKSKIIHYRKNKLEKVEIGFKITYAQQQNNKYNLLIDNIYAKGKELKINGAIKFLNGELNNGYMNIAQMQNSQFTINLEKINNQIITNIDALIIELNKNLIKELKSNKKTRSKFLENFRINFNINKALLNNNIAFESMKGFLKCQTISFCNSGFLNFNIVKNTANEMAFSKYIISNYIPNKLVKRKNYATISLSSIDDHTTKILFESDNISRILLGLNITKEFVKGTISSTINISKTINDNFTTQAKVYVYNILKRKEANITEKILQIENQVKRKLFIKKGEKFIFIKEIYADLEILNNIVNIKKLIGLNFGLSVSSKGTYDINENYINVTGNITPGYGLTSGLSQIPIVGRFFTGKEKEGILRVSYDFIGNLNNNKTSINIKPLSIITPDILTK